MQYLLNVKQFWQMKYWWLTKNQEENFSIANEKIKLYMYFLSDIWAMG